MAHYEKIGAMRYLGGKQQIKKPLAYVLNYQTIDEMYYWEPFCGGCAVATRIKIKNILLSDIQPDLILMWRAIQNGWMPPEHITLEQYEQLKNAPPSPLRGFVGFGCSFGGKWFDGFAREDGRNFAASTKRSLIRDMAHLKRARFFLSDYRDFLPLEKTIIYCDPPYENTTGYDAAPVLDMAEFWDWCQEMARRGHRVFVSSYEAPPNFHCVWELRRFVPLNNTYAVDRLFVPPNQLMVKTPIQLELF